MKIINVNDVDVPFVFTTNIGNETSAYLVQGILNIDKSVNDSLSFEDIIFNNSDVLLDLYGQRSKDFVNRSYDDYVDICTDALMKFEKLLDVKSDEVIHIPFKLSVLGRAYNDNTLIFNNFMQYMQKDTIDFIVYKELCHLYTFKNYGSFAHNKEFYDILYEEYKPSEVKKILEN